MEDFSKKLLNCLLEDSKNFETAAKECLRQELEVCLNSILKSELTAFLDYKFYERNGSDENYRNGCYERILQTEFGNIKINIPRDRLNEFKTKLIKPYQRRTETFEDMILEIAQSGLSRETTTVVLKSLFGTSYSSSTIANIASNYEEEVKAFKNRKLNEEYFAIYLDGTFVPLRRQSVEKECILIALGVKTDGSKEVLGYLISPTESLCAYKELLQNLKSRGLKSNRLFISDGFNGLNALIKQEFPDSDFQRCLVHVLRNINSRVRPKDRKEISEEFKDIRTSSDIQKAKEKFTDFSIKWEKKYKNLGLSLLSPNELFCFMKYPKPIWKSIFSTNTIESLNKEIKRRIKVRIISSEDSLSADLTCIFEQYNLNARKIHNYDLINNGEID